MLAIQTRTLYPTNTRGKRVVAFTCNGHKITRPFDDRLDNVQAHFQVARELIDQSFPYRCSQSTMVYGATQDGYAFCWPESVVES